MNHVPLDLPAERFDEVLANLRSSGIEVFTINHGRDTPLCIASKVGEIGIAPGLWAIGLRTEARSVQAVAQEQRQRSIRGFAA
jgi:hypothetical protein